tara:strand:- start:4587 stop:5264 length:678 start_codon:yes stop_codon:yes gene_type:complete
MLFKSKYMFESKTTKARRALFNLAALLIFASAAYFIVCLALVTIARQSTRTSDLAFFQKHPDLIVVFTGDQGRIPYAIQKARAFRQSQIFISGVYKTNSVDSLVSPLTAGDQVNDIDINMLEIDYQARNTVENVMVTYKHLRHNNALKKVLIISHDYHLARIMKIVESLRRDEDKTEFYYSGVETDFTKWRNIKILATEAFKYTRTWFFLLLWDTDMDQIRVMPD